MSTPEQQANAAKTAGEAWAEYEATVTSRALALCKGQSPYYNVAPLMQLIRDADRLGYKVAAAETEVKS